MERKAAYWQARLQLFRDYDMMDQDPIVSSVLDIYADESTIKNEYGEILQIESDNEKIQEALRNLFYDILNIEFNLWPWTRNMCKYGDFFLYLMVDSENGIVNVLPLPVYELQRNEGNEETDNPFEITFELDQAKAAMPNKERFENFEIAHFRLLSDSNFMPYGKSMIEGGRRIYKQLSLMEDAMLIHRISRAPDKRVFKIDVGNIPPNEVNSYMERLMNQMKRTPLIDKQTGDYNMRFNMQNILEDFYIPVRGKDSGADIDNLPGLAYNAIEDIEYLLRKLLSSFKVPKSFIGYDEDTSGKATLAAQDVRFARTIERIQRILVSELSKIAIVHLYVLGFRDADLVDFKLSLTNPSTIYEIEKINLWKEKTSLAEQIIQSNLFSRDWIYEHIFGIAEENIVIQQAKIVDDAAYVAELQKLAQDIMMPPEAAGEAPPTEPPVEEDMDMFGADSTVDDTDAMLNADDQEVGRPRVNFGHKYNTDSGRGGRDPLGYKEIVKAMGVLPKNKKAGRVSVDPRLTEALGKQDFPLPTDINPTVLSDYVCFVIS